MGGKISKQYRRAWTKANLEKAQDYNRRYRARHPGLAARWCREWRHRNPEKIRFYRRKQRYGITREEYEQLYREQKGVCAICSRVSKNGQLVIDHDHKTRRVRGLLCHICNLTLGQFEDRPEWFLTAAAYVAQT